MVRARIASAFTLIELLVVVAIIALLISILIPSLALAREQANTVVCKTRLRELYHGHVMYASEYGGKFPDPDYWLWRGPMQGIESRRWVEYGQIYRYLRDPQVYFCPRDDRKRIQGSAAIGSGGSMGTSPIHSYVRCADPNTYAYPNRPADCRGLNPNDTWVHYIDPSWLVSGAFTPPMTNPRHVGQNFHQFVRGTPIATRVLLLFEEHPGFGLNGYWQLNDGWSSKVQTIVDFMSNRHRGKGHFLFWDGRIELGDAARWNNYPADDYALQVSLGGPIGPKP
jgi:prepilin-type N-terminal cleavage/methylation domain-containing protein/prepilin-type processing-associated H-X9-DG protein